MVKLKLRCNNSPLQLQKSNWLDVKV